jgi:NADH:ubiquinone oxidoreductase subunit 4 (subunit M)
MYWQTTDKIDIIPVSGLSRVMMSGLIVAIIWLGVYPQPILNALKPKPGEVALRSTAALTR